MGSGSGNSSFNNLKNALIAFLVPLPSIFFYLSFLKNYDSVNSTSGTDQYIMSSLWTWCYHHPLLLANVLFFFNVNVLFWVIGLIQSSHWMIDPYWTVIPVMLTNYYASHPLMDHFDWWRSRIVIFLTWVWSIRLLHNYFRREKWQWGAREDWRFTDLSIQYGSHWWWASFFAIYLPQQVFLIGLSLPFYVVHSVNKPLSMWDLVAVLVCVSGIVIVYFPVLDTDLWCYSRHPNYICEQIWWWD